MRITEYNVLWHLIQVLGTVSISCVERQQGRGRSDRGRDAEPRTAGGDRGTGIPARGPRRSPPRRAARLREDDVRQAPTRCFLRAAGPLSSGCAPAWPAAPPTRSRSSWIAGGKISAPACATLPGQELPQVPEPLPRCSWRSGAGRPRRRGGFKGSLADRDAELERRRTALEARAARAAELRSSCRRYSNAPRRRGGRGRYSG